MSLFIGLNRLVSCKAGNYFNFFPEQELKNFQVMKELEILRRQRERDEAIDLTNIVVSCQ